MVGNYFTYQYLVAGCKLLTTNMDICLVTAGVNGCRDSGGEVRLCSTA